MKFEEKECKKPSYFLPFLGLSSKHGKTPHLNFQHKRLLFFEIKHVKTKACNYSNPFSLIIVIPLIFSTSTKKIPNGERLITRKYSFSLISS